MATLWKIGSYLKNTWAKEPVIVASFAIGTVAILTALLSPSTSYQAKMNQAVPYNYPVPVRDNGNMPDIPAHPCDKLGPSLEWMKNL
ncbi:NADH dehydrogenase [ubiquinone] 1 alpha subcomplex subunit 3-like [Heterodontus francisci]|uniref:NADH dehydrogenase [ubiquinone] 1 alpha subcomplex subunit 3-like n=1 Tax=Heterodontus francisci TaxID=7792 RepID=UPI00355B69E8